MLWSNPWGFDSPWSHQKIIKKSAFYTCPAFQNFANIHVQRMKRFGLILAGCLAFAGVYAAYANDVGDVARAAVRRASTNTTVSSREKSTNTTPRTNTTGGVSTTNNVRNRATTTATRTPGVTERTTTNARTGGNVVPRATTGTVQSRSVANSGRAATRTISKTPDTATTNKTPATSRVATTGTITREDILSRDYAKCKQVFFDCMDEFCANKDSQLKRCACSSRIHEFDSVKKQLAATEEKMLDFNQRLLTVSMEKEDAAALSVATEGEEAYLGTKDKSDSKKTLDAIAKKLNTSFDSSNFNTDLNVLSWSLDIDSAFDSVDSLKGSSATAKSGTALFSAALPICREMAAEVCSNSDVKLAESGYAAAVEQDCNTVAQTYQTQVDQARAKVLEGSALLDMSRLSVHQKRNSDDILTCKKKMLDMLTDTTVCGDDLGKCLDVTGQYIDPSTGEAFLSPSLVNLANLLTRPSDGKTWSTEPKNSAFVSFLNSRKKFLEPAMEQCQDIADSVWDAFIDDALSQIKISQTKKLESVRQSCTELTAQCLSNASESITNFDARALSTFGISADITVNKMCENVLNSCRAILQTSDDDSSGNEWLAGIQNTQTANSYATLMQTCRLVGQSCIIQACRSTSGNFGLCESVTNSTNRKSIINHTVCWDEVKDCIKSAGEETIANIMTQLGLDSTSDSSLNFYDKMYAYFDSDKIIKQNSSSITNDCINKLDDAGNAIESDCVLDLCATECTSTDSASFDCRICRLAENLWGNCEAAPATDLRATTAHNRIKLPKDTSVPTLLYWFAQNTGTTTANDSCYDTTCGIGFYPHLSTETGQIECLPAKDVCYLSYSDSTRDKCITNTITTKNDICQCCDAPDSIGNCCESTKHISATTSSGDSKNYCTITSGGGVVITTEFQQIQPAGTPVANTPTTYNTLICDNGQMQLQDGKPYCTGTLVIAQKIETTLARPRPSGVGQSIIPTATTSTLHYYSPTDPNYVHESFMSTDDDESQCNYSKDDGVWYKEGSSTACSATPKHWSVY